MDLTGTGQLELSLAIVTVIYITILIYTQMKIIYILVTMIHHRLDKYTVEEYILVIMNYDIHYHLDIYTGI